jgi:hypothetical protein
MDIVFTSEHRLFSCLEPTLRKSSRPVSGVGSQRFQRHEAIVHIICFAIVAYRFPRSLRRLSNSMSSRLTNTAMPAEIDNVRRTPALRYPAMTYGTSNSPAATNTGTTIKIKPSLKFLALGIVQHWHTESAAYIKETSHGCPKPQRGI